MKVKRNGQTLVMDTNVKILIVVFVVALVLSGIFFLGGRLTSFYRNIIPSGVEVIEPDDELIPLEERVSYSYVVPERCSSEKTVSFSADSVQKILEESTIFSVKRDGKVIVKGNFNPHEDVNPISNKIELFFPGSNGFSDFFEFRYNAKTKSVTGNYYRTKYSSKSVEREVICLNGQVSDKGALDFLNDEEKENVKKIVCNSDGGLMFFVENILASVGRNLFLRYDCQIKIDGEYSSEMELGPGQTKKDIILNLLKEGRENYVEYWGQNGRFSNTEETPDKKYLCFFDSENSFVDCYLEKAGVDFMFSPSILSLHMEALQYIQRGDEIFYIKDGQIWRLVYPGLKKEEDKIEYLYPSGLEVGIDDKRYQEVVNHCCSSLTVGGSCQ